MFALLFSVVAGATATATATADDRKIDVRITNDSSSSALQVYWQVGADFQATPRNFRSYRALSPGQSIAFASSVDQNWLVFDARTKRAVGMLKASFRQRQLNVTDRDIQEVQGRAYRARFHNRTGRTVAVYLVLGRRELPHSTIAPGRVMTQEVWGRQKWEFRDYETGRELRSFVAPQSNAEIVIEPARRGGRHHPVHTPEVAQELLIDNQTGRQVLFWFEGQRGKNRINSYRFEAVPIEIEDDRAWFISDRATGRYLACGANLPSTRRITLAEEDCAPALAPAVELTLRNYHDAPAYAYPMLGRDPLPGVVIAAGELRRVDSFVGQRWEFRTSDRSRKLGSYQCSADEPSAAIGRPRFQRYRGKVDFTIENHRSRSIDVSVDHGDHVDLIETVSAKSRKVVQLDAGEDVILTDHRSKEVLETARVSLRDPVVVLYPDGRGQQSERHDHEHHDDRVSDERPRTLSDLLGDLFNRDRR
ncbi:MAG: hypothetical protein ACI9R3_000845 [Verrucomicrobiales bacterium]|jgi:hypothetical protein